ncbi:MAG: DUF935 family protein [Bacteroidales bacterium]|nr:DUF935 family protein [Candidatus Cryptobacteroides equifaecalis]
MKLLTFFNRTKDKAQTTREPVITAGGQISRPGATIILQQPARFGIDIGDYKAAVSGAENVDYTRRTRLYDIYSNILMDPHLGSVIQKRKAAILGSPIEFRRRGVPDDRINDNIRSPWFYRFIGDVLDAKFWGLTLVQFFINEKGWIDYTMVPRKHVDPQLRLIRRRQSDVLGIPFDEYGNLLLIEGPEPLGALARCAPYVIYKTGTMGDWSEYSEVFGMPIREYIYDAADDEARRRTMEDAQSLGSNGVYIHPEGSSLRFQESGNKSGSADVYDRLVERCNAELSKAILCNTLTTEASDTGTQALGTVHREVEEELAADDRVFVLNVLNYEMADIFRNLGMDTSGGEFVFVEPERMSAAEKADLFRKALDMGLPISDDYMYEQLGIEKPDDYKALKDMENERRQRQLETLRGTQDSPQNRARRFFGEAPAGDGASEW